MDTTFTINSLSEYINVIKENKLIDCYYRGENNKYDNISSSLLRNHTSINKTQIYNNLLKEYYQEVGYELDNIQSDNFVAFSQHHGLKTNLIDFTTAPLVALYFACDGFNSYDGYVYLIKQLSTINASDFLNKYSFKDKGFNNIFYDLLDKDIEMIDDFTNILKNYAFNNMSKNTNYTVNGLKENNIDLIKNNKEVFKNANKIIDELEKIDKYDKTIINKVYNNFIPKFKLTIDNMLVSDYTIILLSYLLDIDTLEFNNININNDIKFPQVPYLMYKTPLKFDRIKNQCGIFLYQGFLDYYDKIYNLSIINQEIIPEFTIIVKNKNEILNELDMVGINKKFIFGDFDNIAYYVNLKELNNS